MCSFFTAMLSGPMTARGRNEGFLKDRWEIGRMIPVWNIVTFVHHGRIAQRGMTLAEYQDDVLRSHLNLNMYPDVLATIDECENRGLVSPPRADAFRRHLCQCNFLNTDVLIAAAQHDALTRREARDLFFRWLQRVGGYEKVNFYILTGNRHMMRKLVEARLLDEREATHFLRLWLVNLKRIDFSMLEDVEYFNLLDATDLKVLVCRETAVFLGIASARGLPVSDARVQGEGDGSDAANQAVDIRQCRRKWKDDIRKPKTFPNWF